MPAPARSQQLVPTAPSILALPPAPHTAAPTPISALPWRVFLGCSAYIQPVSRHVSYHHILGIPLYPCICIYLDL